MNDNLAATRAWYEAHNRLEEFYKKYICSECRYCYTCSGVAEEVRVQCAKYQKGYAIVPDAAGKPSKPWNEMSHHRIPTYGSVPQSLRMRLEDAPLEDVEVDD